MATFLLKDIRNPIDIDMLRKGRCPWCLAKLTPMFHEGEHVSDQCIECEDTFAGTLSESPPRVVR
jgi:hypothetical protein